MPQFWEPGHPLGSEQGAQVSSSPPRPQGSCESPAQRLSEARPCRGPPPRRARAQVQAVSRGHLAKLQAWGGATPCLSCLLIPTPQAFELGRVCMSRKRARWRRHTLINLSILPSARKQGFLPVGLSPLSHFSASWFTVLQVLQVPAGHQSARLRSILQPEGHLSVSLFVRLGGTSHIMSLAHHTGN